jgi:heme/copper-type cytochrome/quinol oxidase subunit 2|tara:strand:+ start:405 stop:626 length:222 start_codon:yes stop_codon:yes gene_type:complete
MFNKFILIMGFSIAALFFLLLGIFFLFKGIFSTQKKDKRYKKGVKHKTNFKFIVLIIASLACFFISYKIFDII